MPAGEQAVDDPHAARRGDDERGPPLPRLDAAVGARDGLQRAHDGRPDGDDAPAPAARGLDEARGRGRHAEALGVRALAALGRGDAGVQDDRRDRHAARRQRGEDGRRHRAPGAGHLGAAGLGRVGRLVGRQRVGVGHVAVADRRPVAGQVGQQRLGQLQARGPQARAGEVGRLERRAPAARPGRARRRRGRRGRARPPRAARRPSDRRPPRAAASRGAARARCRRCAGRRARRAAWPRC